MGDGPPSQGVNQRQPVFSGQTIYSFIILLLVVPVLGPASELPEVQFEEGPRVITDEPHTTLSWSPPEPDPGLQFELQQAPDADFTEPYTRYQGQDQASFISGLAEGEFFFRVRAVSETGEQGPWSETLVVEVEYVSMAYALLLFSIGAVVTIATILLVVTGDRKVRRETAANSEDR